MGTQNQNPTYCPACGQLECDHFCIYCGGPWKYCLGQHYIPQQQQTNQPPPFIQGAVETIDFLWDSVWFFLLPLIGLGGIIVAFVAPASDTIDGPVTPSFVMGRILGFVGGVLVLVFWWYVYGRNLAKAQGWDKRTAAWKEEQLEIMRQEDKGEYTHPWEDSFSWAPTYRSLYRRNHQQPEDKGDGTSYWGPSRK